MNFFEAVILLSAIIGALTAFGAFIFHVITRKKDGVLSEDRIDDLLDEALMELNRMSSLAMSELEDKNKELTFLYGMIDDKLGNLDNTIQEIAKKSVKAEILNQMPSFESLINKEIQKNVDFDSKEKSEELENELIEKPSIDLVASGALFDVSVGEKKAVKRKHPLWDSIKQFRSEGMSDAEIARKLRLSVGEIVLITELGEEF